MKSAQALMNRFGVKRYGLLLFLHEDGEKEVGQDVFKSVVVLRHACWRHIVVQHETKARNGPFFPPFKETSWPYAKFPFGVRQYTTSYGCARCKIRPKPLVVGHEIEQRRVIVEFAPTSDATVEHERGGNRLL